MPKKAPKKSLKLTQIKSTIGCPADQRATVKALGLKRIRDSIEQVDTPAVQGMIFKVKHLVKVEKL